MGTRKIKIGVNNRQDDTGAAAEKYDFSFFLFPATGSTPFGPYKGPKSVHAHDFTSIDVQVSDEPCIAVQFMWRNTSNAKMGNSVKFTQDSASHGQPWSAVYLEFSLLTINGSEYEYVDGGLSRGSSTKFEMV